MEIQSESMKGGMAASTSLSIQDRDQQLRAGVADDYELEVLVGLPQAATAPNSNPDHQEISIQMIIRSIIDSLACPT
jgi:hypothetical protein